MGFLYTSLSVLSAGDDAQGPGWKASDVRAASHVSKLDRNLRGVRAESHVCRWATTGRQTIQSARTHVRSPVCRASFFGRRHYESKLVKPGCEHNNAQQPVDYIPKGRPRKNGSVCVADARSARKRWMTSAGGWATPPGQLLTAQEQRHIREDRTQRRRLHEGIKSACPTQAHRLLECWAATRKASKTDVRTSLTIMSSKAGPSHGPCARCACCRPPVSRARDRCNPGHHKETKRAKYHV